MSKKTLFHYATPAIITGMLFATVAISWDEPGNNPPGGNVPAPINISADSQYKEGKLNIGNIQVPDAAFTQLEVRGGGGFRTVGGAVLNTGGAADGLIVENGNVGIGTDTPSKLLHVQGDPDFNLPPQSYAGEILFEVDEVTIRDSSPALIFKTTDFGAAEHLNFGIASYSDDKFYIFSVKNDGITKKKNRLVIDGSNGRVGIGTKDPLSQLHLKGGFGNAGEILLEHNGIGGSAGIVFDVTNDTNRFSIKSHDDRLKFIAGGNLKVAMMPSGRVGIGTIDPLTKLHVVGDTPDNIPVDARILVENINAASKKSELCFLRPDTGVGGWCIGTDFWSQNDDDFFIWGGGATDGGGGDGRLYIDNTGNIGIGTNSPSAKLEVDGGVRLNTATARPACNATTRGTFWFTQGAGAMGVPGIKDKVEVCVKDALGNGVWFAIY